MTTRPWNGSVSSDWTDADNWDTGVPVDGDDVVNAAVVSNPLNLIVFTPLSLASLIFTDSAANIAGSLIIEGDANLGYGANAGAGVVVNGLLTIAGDGASITGGTFNGGITGNIIAPAGGATIIVPRRIVVELRDAP